MAKPTRPKLHRWIVGELVPGVGVRVGRICLCGLRRRWSAVFEAYRYYGPDGAYRGPRPGACRP